jgi:hypothetical protein
MTFPDYIDEIFPWVEERKIKFTNEKEALDWFLKCSHRPSWRTPGCPEYRTIMKILTVGLGTAGFKKEKALSEFIKAFPSEHLLPEESDLNQKENFDSLISAMSEINAVESVRWGLFLRQSVELITYLKTIIQSPNGHFPYEGASQNRVL